MQEFSSVTASSYDAESLAPMLTEKAQEGWSVVSIVSAGTNVVAYLTRGADAAPAVADAAADTGDAESPSDSVAPVAAAAVGGVAAGAAAASVTDSWSTDADDATADSAAVPADATAIAPTLPGEISTPDAPVVEASPEAAAAVEASGEPAGWGAAPAAEPAVPEVPTVPEAAPALGDDDSAGLGALAGGVGAAAAGGAAIVGDAASDVTGGLGDSAGDAAGGLADTATDLGTGVTESIGDATSGATDAVTGAADTTTDAAAGVADTADAAADTAVGATDEAASGVPAGWYADPSGRFELRYWDGNAWTEHVSRAGQQYTDPPVA